MRGLGLWLLLAALLSAAAEARACRCPERSLAEYFSDADEVFVARLESVSPRGEEWSFDFEAGAPRLKATAEATAQYLSHGSSAACAVEREPGAVYVVFAQYDPDGVSAWLTSCNGTRIHRSKQGDVHGFEDVPPRFVQSQLNGLAGLEALSAILAQEPSPDDPESESLVGLLDIAPFAHGGHIDLHREPVAAAEAVASVSSMAELRHREAGYEFEAAEVYAVLEGWYKLRLETGAFGWLPQHSGGTYWPLDELPVGRLAYLNTHWSGFVWPEAGAGLPQRSSLYGDAAYPRGEYPARVLESRRIGGSLWFRVEILNSDGCQGGEPRSLLGGWVPAYGSGGEPAVWFHSRGC